MDMTFTIKELDEIIDDWNTKMDANGNPIYAPSEITQKFREAGWDGGRYYCCHVELVYLTGDLSKYSNPTMQSAWFAKSDNNGTCYLGFYDAPSASKEKSNEPYNMAAKETIYDGIVFRSRLETRWAVFFDCLEWEWQYEPERFECCFGGNTYLPDFYLPKYQAYAEVKGTDKQLFSAQERISGAIDFNASPVSDGLLLLGNIPFNASITNGCGIYGDYLFCNEGVCLGTFEICPDQQGAYLNFTRSKKRDTYSVYPDIPKSSSVNLQVGCAIDSKERWVYNALLTARSARFDFDDSIDKAIKDGRKIIGGYNK